MLNLYIRGTISADDDKINDKINDKIKSVLLKIAKRGIAERENAIQDELRRNVSGTAVIAGSGKKLLFD